MLKKLTPYIALLGIISASCEAGKVAPQPQKKTPKLVIGIVVDQMRYDYLERFESQYGQNGFKRLMSGINHTQHHFSYVPTATGPGHASIYTGSTPKTHGIIGNNWPQKHDQVNRYCVQDDSVQCVGMDDPDGARSPKNLKVASLGDWIKETYGGKVVGLSIKDRGAILPAGHAADAAYWMSTNDSVAHFVTSTYYMQNLPEWVSAFNAENKALSYLQQGWQTLLPLDNMTQSGPDYRKRENSLNKGEDPVFPYDLMDAASKKGMGVIKLTPYGNEILADFAEAAIENEQLGADSITDLLTVSFSSPDYIGHSYGPNSKEIHDMYLRLDATLADFLTYLDQQVGKGEYVVFLTADHGAAPIPNEEEAPYFSYKNLLKAVNDSLNSAYGVDSVFFKATNFQLFADSDRLALTQKQPAVIYSAARDILINQTGIDTAYMGSQIANASSKGSKEWFLQMGWDAKMSGEVLFITKEGWLPSHYHEKGGTGHGTHWSYDTHVPFLIYGANVLAKTASDTHWVHQILPDIQEVILK